MCKRHLNKTPSLVEQGGSQFGMRRVLPCPSHAWGFLFTVMLTEKGYGDSAPDEEYVRLNLLGSGLTLLCLVGLRGCC